jgi:hypothetical protein
MKAILKITTDESLCFVSIFTSGILKDINNFYIVEIQGQRDILFV